jgi:hypothetical protein
MQAAAEVTASDALEAETAEDVQEGDEGEDESQHDDEDGDEPMDLDDTYASREAVLLQWLERWTHGDPVERAARTESRQLGMPQLVRSSDRPGYALPDVLQHITVWKALPPDSPEYRVATDTLLDMLDSLREDDMGDFLVVSQAMFD